MAEECENETELSILITLLKSHKILLSKSNIPHIREQKKKGAEKIAAAILTCTGKRHDEKAILKKIANLKSRVKAKTDKNATGNRKIKLLPWEEELLALMESDENPIFQKVPGKNMYLYI